MDLHTLTAANDIQVGIISVVPGMEEAMTRSVEYCGNFVINISHTCVETGGRLCNLASELYSWRQPYCCQRCLVSNLEDVILVLKVT